MNIPSKIVCAVLLLTPLGCGSSDRMQTAPVRGKVTLDGQPYSHAGTVRFEPEVAGKMATGQIQSDGSFELATYAAGDGAIVGKHKVTVFPLPAPIVNESIEARAKATAPIPPKYGSTSTSGLSYDVQPGRTNEFPIELKSR